METIYLVGEFVFDFHHMQNSLGSCIASEISLWPNELEDTDDLWLRTKKKSNATDAKTNNGS